jgi:hypothetical protein
VLTVFWEGTASPAQTKDIQDALDASTDGVYDHADQSDFREALGTIASELL